MSENKVVDIILHCQKQLKKERLPEEKLLHYLGRLSRLRITVPDLAETGIGRTVNSLSRNESPVGQAAETLVRSWKLMVSEQQSQAEAQQRESEEESDSNSGSSDEDEDELKIDVKEPYEIDEQVGDQVEGEPYQNGHAASESGPENSSSQNTDFVEEDEEDDDIEDPYMDGGFLDMAKLQTDADEDDEEEEEDNGNESDSDSSDRLRIANEEQKQTRRESESLRASPYIKQEPLQMKTESENIRENIFITQEPPQIKRESENLRANPYIKQEPPYMKRETESPPLDSPPLEKGKEHKSSSAKSSSHIQSSSSASKSHHHERSSSSSKSHSSSSKESAKEQKSHKESKEHRSSKHSDHNLESKSRHHHSSKSHHEREKTSSKDKHRSKEGSSHRESREKERSTEKKDATTQNRSSSNSSMHLSKDKTRDMSSLKSSSPERKKAELHEERKRKEPSDNESSTSSKKSKLIIKEEIDSTSGVNFSDVLGSLDVPSSSPSKPKKVKKEEHEKSHDRHESRKKKHEKSSSSASSSKYSREREGEGSSSKKSERDSEKSPKKPVHAKLESVAKPVANISPNYKPVKPTLPAFPRPSTSNGSSATLLSHSDLSDLGHIDYYENNERETAMSQEDAISTMLSNRNARSKVFSGVKLTRRGALPSLFDLCMQVIKDNIGDLGYTGGIPYDILKPALERANPQQLMSIEAQNDHLIGETDELWQFHCRRDFREKCPGETESWRDLYERCKDGQQQKFEQIRKKMKLDMMKRETAEPVRKTKLAFVETTSGPRYSKEKAQTIKNGMKSLKIKEEKGVKRGVSSSASAGFNNPKITGDPTNIIVQEASVIIAPGSRSGHAPAPPASRESTAKLKPKKAPLMQKTMKLIRSLNRR